MPRKGYDHTRFATYLEKLLAERNESYRQASLRAGLDVGAVRRYVNLGTQPLVASCIALAEHFGVSANKMLEAAGHDPLAVLDPSLSDPSALPPEVGEVAGALAGIRDPERRCQLCAVVRELISLCVASSQSRPV